MPTQPPSIQQLQRQQHGQPAERKTARQRGYTHAWDKYALWFLLQPGNQNCVMCKAEGVTKLAECVDHIQDATNRPDLFWEPSNHQPLCIRHNTLKSQRNA